MFKIIKERIENNNLGVKRSNEIVDFKGYYLKQIEKDITVEEFEQENKHHIIEQVFYNNLPEYIKNNLSLKIKLLSLKNLSHKIKWMILMNFDTITVGIFGLGHIGLPTAAILANNDIHVIGADVNEDTVNIINQGRCSFSEPGLDDLVKNAVRNNYLSATSDLDYVAKKQIFCLLLFLLL